MGEARRRKAAQATRMPDGKDFAARRRFWCGQDVGPVEDFVAPFGTVAITIDVQGVAPSTCMLDASSIAGVVDQVHQLASSLDYRSLVRHVAAEFAKAKRPGGDASAFEWLGIVILWTALHHPDIGRDMRDGVSDALCREGKAHITWQFSPSSGLAMALGPGFIDLEPIAAAAPQGAVLKYFKPRDGDAEPMQ